MGALRRIGSMVALAGLLVAAACSGGSPSPRTGSSTPHHGGVLRLAVTQLGSLDPAVASTPEQQVVASALFRTLTAYDPVSQTIVPALARTWKASTDQQQWDFTLQPGARFSTGQLVGTSDVVATFDRIAAKGSSSPVTDLLAPVAGFAAVNVGGGTRLSGITVPAVGVVRISLSRPMADLPSLLSNPDFGVVSLREASASAAAFTHQPDTSGPFVIKSSSASSLVLVPAPGSPAYVSELHVETLADPTAIYSAFVHGSVDWAVVPPAQLADAARRFGQGGFRPLAAELFYGFNLSDPVFADRRFRQAVIQAIDRTALVASAYGVTALPFDGLVVDGVEGHQTDPCGAACRYDPAAARALLAQLPASVRTASFSIDYDQDPTQDQIAHAIQTDLKAVGLTVTLRPTSLAVYQTAVLDGQVQLFRLGWVAAYPSAEAFLSPLFATGAATNVTHFSDPGVDGLLASASRQPDPTKRTADYQQAEQRILGDLPVVPVAQFESHDVIAARVHGLLINPLGTFDPALVWVD